MITLSALALAGTLTVHAPRAEVRPTWSLPGPEPRTVETVGDGVRATVDEGWYQIRGEGAWTFDVWVGADADLQATPVDGHWTLEGPGAQVPALLVALHRGILDVPGAPSPKQLARHAKGIRARVRKARLPADDARRAENQALGLLADRAAATTASQVLLDDATWYATARDALGWHPSIVDAPAFWNFGWSYGRMCGGVTAFGLARAIERDVARTDAEGVHPTIAGSMAWAIESASTDEQLDALRPGLAAWEALGPPPALLARHLESAEAKLALRPGEPAPALQATGHDGEPVSLQGLSERLTVVDFWGTWCGPCIQAIPHMKELQARYGDRATFLAVAAEEPGMEGKWKATIRKHDWGNGFVHAWRPDREVPHAWAIHKYPSYAVVAADGTLLGTGLVQTELDAVLERELGDPPATPEAQAE